MAELTYKYRIYPTRQQVSAIQNICGATRFLYNKLLEDRTRHYREKRQWKRLDSKPFIEIFPFLAQTDQGALAWTVNRLERAYQHFFFVAKTELDRYKPEALERAKNDKKYVLLDTDLVSYPEFKRKKETKISYTTIFRDIDVQNKRILLPVLGRVKIAYHRPVPEEAQIINCTILKNKAGIYFILVRLSLQKPEKAELQNALGLVFVPGQVAVRSDGESVNVRHQSKEQNKRIQKAYRTLKRRKYGSRRYEAQREYLASLYEKRVNQRRDDLHKAARQIANAADALYLQQPNVRKRAAEQKTARARAAIWDEAWFTIFSFVKYKAELDGKQFWGVPIEYPAYYFCSACGAYNKEPGDGAWICPSCGSKMDRHLNAANNLRLMGEKFIREWNELQKQEK